MLGCLVAVGVALLVLGVAVAGIYIAFEEDTEGVFTEDAPAGGLGFIGTGACCFGVIVLLFAVIGYAVTRNRR